MKKGFTLIELLAVIVILAIIALIATPIVLNIINDTKESATLRSAEFYLAAVELAIAQEKMDNPNFNPNLCIIQKNNEISCDGIQNGKILKLQLKGEEISGGYIKIKDGLPTNYSIKVGEKEVTTELLSNELEETPKECFQTVDNYEYEINEATCNSYLESIFESEEVARAVCSGQYGDVVYFSYLFDISKEELIENNIISNLKETGTLSIAGYACGGENGEYKDVVVPKKIDGKQVSEIGVYSFSPTFIITEESQKTINSIVIPNSVTTIGDDAFAGNQLTSIVIPSGVTTIGNRTFYDNGLTSIVIPNSVTTIGNDAFNGNGLTSIVIPNSVTTIGNSAFAYNELTSIVIPNSVTTIGNSAFAGNQLTSVTIPDSVTEIYDFAFEENQLTSVVIKEKSNEYDFDYYGSDVFGWADGYSDENIIWQP